MKNLVTVSSSPARLEAESCVEDGFQTSCTLPVYHEIHPQPQGPSHWFSSALGFGPSKCVILYN